MVLSAEYWCSLFSETGRRKKKKSLLSIKTEGPQGFEEGQRRQLPSILILNTSGPSNYSTGRIGFGQLTTERPRGCGIKRGWRALSNSNFLPSLEVFQNPLGAVGWSRVPKRSFHLYTWANAQDMHHPASPMTDSRGSSTHWALGTIAGQFWASHTGFPATLRTSNHSLKKRPHLLARIWGNHL